MKLLSAILFLYLLMNTATAQIDLQCNDRDLHSLYLISYTSSSTDGYYRIDNIDSHPSPIILVAPNDLQQFGISINNNLDSSAGGVTMYSVGLTSTYYYWGGTHWVNSNHSTGGAGAVNPGGVNGYIFNIGGSTVYRYDASGNTTAINISPISSYLPDVATDMNGNFYLLDLNNSNILAFNPDGIPLDTFRFTGGGNGGGGFTIVGSRMYTTQETAGGNEGLYEGIISNHVINFSLIDSFTYTMNDLASCPNSANPLSTFKVPDAPHFIIYPNPATDVAIARLDNTVTLDVTDCMGRKIMSVETQGLTEYRLPVNNWAHGIYIVTATSGSGKTAHLTLLVQ